MDPRHDEPKERKVDQPTEAFCPIEAAIPPTLPLAQVDETKRRQVADAADTIPVAASEETVAADAHKTVTAQPVLRTFGDYELLAEIARGGMGVVYKARQRGLNRTVALKMILTGQLADKDEIQRFHAEAEAAAGLDHPGIVPIYEVGQHEGQHFFSMGLVDGDSLASRLVKGPLAPQAAAELISKVAEAVHYAHRAGVVHRDLKPANILLDRNDDPRITDFGLAKRMESDSNFTASGQVLGTPNYMPPEQALGLTNEIGPCSDVYSLGGVLYTATTGRPPFLADNPIDTLRQVVDQEPVSPRQLNPSIPRDLETITLKCLNKESHKRYASASDLADDLKRFAGGEPILARPIGKIESAWCWSRRQPVIASLLLLLLLAISTGFGVSWYFAIEAGQRAEQAERYRKKAEDNLTTARENANRANVKSRLAAEQTKRADNNAAKAKEAQLREARRREEAEQQTRLANSNRLAAQAREAIAIAPQQAMLLAVEATRLRSSVDAPPVLAARQSLRHVLSQVGGQRVSKFDAMFRHVAVTTDSQRVVTLDGYTMKITSIAHANESTKEFRFKSFVQNFLTHDNGQHLITGHVDGSISVWDLSTLGLEGERFPPLDEPRFYFSPKSPLENKINVRAVEASVDGTRMVRVNLDKTIQVWDISAVNPVDSVITLSCAEKDVAQISLSPDNRWLAGGCFKDGPILLWDLKSGETDPRLFGLEGASVSISSNSRWLVASRFSKIVIYDLHADDPTTPYTTFEYESDMPRVACSAKHPWMAISLQTGVIELWDVSSEPRKVLSLFAGSPNVGKPNFSLNGRWLAASIKSNQVMIWDLAAENPGAASSTLRGHDNYVVTMAFCPDGRGIVTASRDQTTRYWDLTKASPAISPATIKLPVQMDFSATGDRLLTYDAKLGVRIWRLNTKSVELERRAQCKTMPENIQNGSVAISPDARWLVGVEGSSVRRWNLTAPDPMSTETRFDTNVGGPAHVTISSDSQWVVVDNFRDGIRLWQLGARDPLMSVIPLDGPSQVIIGRAFSPDGRFLAMGDYEGKISMWDLKANDIAASRTEIVKPGKRGPGNAVAWIDFGLDGRWLAAQCIPEGFFVWRLDSDEPTLHVSELELSDTTFQVAVSTRVSRVKKGVPHVWDLTNSDKVEPRQLPLAGRLIEMCTVSPDGNVLATESEGEIRLWNLNADDPTASSIVIHQNDRNISMMKFSPDSRWLLTMAQNGMKINLWQVRLDDLVDAAEHAAGRVLTDEERALYQID